MKNNKHRLWQFIYKLHRYIGLLSALVLIMLAITGISLNHTEDLQLDSQMVQSTTILHWYGIKSTAKLTSFATQNHWITQLKQKVYFDQSFLIENQQPLLGAIETDEFIVVAFHHSLLLLTHSGELIEQSSIDGIENIGMNQQQAIILKSSRGINVSTDGLISWQPYTLEQITWSAVQHTPTHISTSIENKFLTSILPLERVLLDIHSGRFFGKIGVFIVDLSAVFLIILAFSGCAIWLNTIFKNK